MPRHYSGEFKTLNSLPFPGSGGRDIHFPSTGSDPQHWIRPTALAAKGPVSPAHFPPPPPASVGALGTASDHRGHQKCLLSWGAEEVSRKYTMSRKQVLRQMETPRTFGGLFAPHWQHNPWQRAAQSGRLLLSSRLGLLGGASVECDVFCLAPGAHDSLATPPHPPADATHVPPMSSRT